MAASTVKQKKQWKLWQALGYTIAMRGYLHCWDGLLAACKFPLLGAARMAITNMMRATHSMEADIRYQLKNIK